MSACAGCSLPIDEGWQVPVPYRGDKYHADCWLKKLGSIGAHHRVEPVASLRMYADTPREAVTEVLSEDDDDRYAS